MSGAPETLFDQFEVLGNLRGRGIADSYKVREHGTGQIYELRVHYLADGEARARLTRGAEIHAGLQHPNIAQLIRVVEDEDRVGLLMEHIEGPTLREMFDSRATFSLDEALTIFRQILGAVAAAHARGIVHRDLEPRNVVLLVGEHGYEARVTDFKLALVNSRPGDVRLTTAGSSLGLAGYMAPEQHVDASSVGPQGDVFSLGAILYELVAGMPAFFVPTDTTASLSNTMHGSFVPIEERIPDCPPNVREAIERTLVVDDAVRLASCEALEAVLYPPAQDAVEPSSAAPADTGEQVKGTRNMPMVALAIAVLAGLVIAAILAMS